MSSNLPYTRVHFSYVKIREEARLIDLDGDLTVGFRHNRS